MESQRFVFDGNNAVIDTQDGSTVYFDLDERTANLLAGEMNENERQSILLASIRDERSVLLWALENLVDFAEAQFLSCADLREINEARTVVTNSNYRLIRGSTRMTKEYAEALVSPVRCENIK